jgi:hypothetical protein
MPLPHTTQQISRRTPRCDAPRVFERGVAVLSFDTEQIWGHLDLLSASQFEKQYPGVFRAHENLLTGLASAGISATWFVVGGMTLGWCEGARDSRMAGLPAQWTAPVPAGGEATLPLWYRPSFVERLRKATPHQEIGLHGGLTHLIWTAPHVTADVVSCELAEGIRALRQAHIRPRSFSFPRDQEAHHQLLSAHGIRCFRGRTPVLAYRLGRTLPGAALRILDELRQATPPPVWPYESLPGLWNIPSSLFLYPIGRTRTRVAPLRTRVERFRLGLEAAIRYRGIFHFCLHPDNLTESPDGFAMFEDILDQLVRTRDRGDIEILTMAEIAERMEKRRTEPLQRVLSGPVTL